MQMTTRDADETPEIAPAFYTVAVYLADRAFGGREEGGWWYDTGELVTHAEGEPLPVPVITKTIEEAKTASAAMQATLNATVNVGRRGKSSVLSQGVYEAQIHENHAPPFYPAVRPHYE